MKASKTLEYIEAHIDEITADQIGRCTKIYDYQAKEYFYLVENEAGEVDGNGEIIEYPVRYNAEDGFTCKCKSGIYKFHNVKNPSGVCKHVRWSIAASIEDRKALALRANEARRLVEEKARKAVPIEVKWNVPGWMFERPVAPHMKHSPREM